jgi:hypothetical protein
LTIGSDYWIVGAQHNGPEPAGKRNWRSRSAGLDAGAARSEWTALILAAVGVPFPPESCQKKRVPMTSESSSRIDEIADGIYRISTPIPPTVIPGGFTFNQFLIDDDEPLLFHTGPRKLFPLV